MEVDDDTEDSACDMTWFPPAQLLSQAQGPIGLPACASLCQPVAALGAGIAAGRCFQLLSLRDVWEQL